MSEKPPPKPATQATKEVAPQKLSAIVIRSPNVPAGLPYIEYNPYLRSDFYFSCAYCSMTECEAQGIRFTIDHYEPVSAKPELVDEYGNLMYACEECNARKGDRCPPPAARAAGMRFFRIDEQPRSEHFRVDGYKIEGTTETGRYTVDAVDLNRASLVRLREIRQKLFDYEGYVGEGIVGLAGFALDKLEPTVRARARAAINEAMKAVEEVFEDFDELLIEFAKSDLLIDEKTEEDKQRNKERLARLREQEGIYPGVWRGRKGKKKKH